MIQSRNFKNFLLSFFVDELLLNFSRLTWMDSDYFGPLMPLRLKRRVLISLDPMSSGSSRLFPVIKRDRLQIQDNRQVSTHSRKMRRKKKKKKEREEKKKGVQVYFQSIFSFWTSLGASTNSFPLKRMTAAVRALAMPQNTMYASVSVHVSPESERERGVLTSDNRHVYRQLTSDRSFSRVLGCWFKYARILWTVFFFFLPAISRHRMHMEKATSMMMGN